MHLLSHDNTTHKKLLKILAICVCSTCLHMWKPHIAQWILSPSHRKLVPHNHFANYIYTNVDGYSVNCMWFRIVCVSFCRNGWYEFSILDVSPMISSPPFTVISFFQKFNRECIHLRILIWIIAVFFLLLFSNTNNTCNSWCGCDIHIIRQMEICQICTWLCVVHCVPYDVMCISHNMQRYLMSGWIYLYFHTMNL